MRAMFKVTFRQVGSSHAFTSENVIAESAVKAIQIASKDVIATYSDEQLFVSDVELLGVETVEAG